MFQSARLKLTAWYLAIIMAISILFSMVLYQAITQEVDRSLRVQQFRIFRSTHPDIFFISPDTPTPDEAEVFTEASKRIQLLLILINAGIFVIAGGAGYFLAGRTLKPIQEMVDEQNRFITDASHELRTPLTALRSEIEVNLRDTGLTLPDAKKLLTSNLEEVQNLQVLSDNLLELTQLQKPSQAVKIGAVDTQQIVEDAIRRVHTFAKGKEITIQAHISNSHIKGDKQSLVQLLVIFLDNAIKYSDVGKKILLTVKEDDHTVVITIADHGIGIKKQDLPHIFDRFYRADTSRSKQAVPGYGLGLSIAKKIIVAHKGSISVKSTYEKGTTFTISLPKGTKDSGRLQPSTI